MLNTIVGAGAVGPKDAAPCGSGSATLIICTYLYRRYIVEANGWYTVYI
jgi:hypothetical protein